MSSFCAELCGSSSRIANLPLPHPRPGIRPRPAAASGRDSRGPDQPIGSALLKPNTFLIADLTIQRALVPASKKSRHGVLTGRPV